MAQDFPFKNKFAIGYYFHFPGKFMDTIRPYIPALAEIYFPLPGILSARELSGDEDAQRAQLVKDLRECRENGIKLDLLINATCYGEKSYTAAWRKTVEGAIEYLDSFGLKPEVVTTTSPFVAKSIKNRWPEIDIRGSVNLKIGSTLALEYVEDLYDSFYMNRDLQRDIPTLKLFSEWCKAHGKKLCMLANSGCLRNCPTQVFHETLLAHGFWRAGNERNRMKQSPTLCMQLITEQNKYEEILRQTWVRPEDLHYYDPYVEVFKLSTRDPSLDVPTILKAYCYGKWDGDLCEIIDPRFVEGLRGKIIDNSAFPEDWVPSGIAGLCAVNCTHCGKCTEVLKKVLKDNPDYKPPIEEQFTMNLSGLTIGQYSFK